MAALRFGLVGTGYWARVAHAPALASTDGIEFTAVWGRNLGAATELAAGYGARPHDDIDAFLAGVDGVAFAVPPDVQAPIATRAARAGKHLLLEKPIAVSDAEADDLVAAAEASQVATVVFSPSGSPRTSGPGWPRSPAAAGGAAAARPGSGHRCWNPARSTARGGATRAPCGISRRIASRCCGRVLDR